MKLLTHVKKHSLTHLHSDDSSFASSQHTSVQSAQTEELLLK